MVTRSAIVKKKIYIYIYLVYYRNLSLLFPIYIRIAKINIKLSQISSTKHDHYMTSEFRISHALHEMS